MSAQTVLAYIDAAEEGLELEERLLVSLDRFDEPDTLRRLRLAARFKRALAQELFQDAWNLESIVQAGEALRRSRAEREAATR